jgi:hypothetical protein
VRALSSRAIIEALVGHWKAARLSNGTLKNRMGWLRYWA